MYDSRKDTQEHIMKVRELLTRLQVNLEDRKRLHDHSKLKTLKKPFLMNLLQNSKTVLMK
jgi:hypothetical protein